MIRRVCKAVLSVEQAEGVGARVRRSIGRREVSKVAETMYARISI